MQWKPTDSTDPIFEGGDPYYWLRVGAEATFDPRDLTVGKVVRRPIIIRLQPDITASAFAQYLAHECAAHVSVPELYTDPIAILENARYCTAIAEPEFFELLNDSDNTLDKQISRITVLPPIEQHDAPIDVIPKDNVGPFEYSGNGTVVIGIIDYGIAFAHERFRRTKETTRIEYLWVQDDGPVSASSVPYGREICASNINYLLSKKAGFVSEDALYQRAARHLGLCWLRSVSKRISHANFVMDLACGFDLTDVEKEQRERRPIVCVQLPEPATANTSGKNLDAYALDAIRYILKRADEIAQRDSKRKHLPVVINFSYGNVAGNHDHTSNLVAAMDELIDLRSITGKPLEIILPAGNSHLGRLHAKFSFPRPDPKANVGEKPCLNQPFNKDRGKFDKNSEKLHWRVLPDDRTPSFLEIWLPRTENNRPGARRRKNGVELCIETPTGIKSRLLDERRSGAGVQLVSDEGPLCVAFYHFIGEPTYRGMFLIALQPTMRNDLARSATVANPIAPSGTWIVTLKKKTPGEVTVEAWIQRDDVPYGFRPRGRQSYFDEACYQRFNAQGWEIEEDPDGSPCHIRRAGSINAIATGKETIVVGGYLRKEMRPAKYSARGPLTRVVKTRDVNRYGPNVLAVSDDSIVKRGVLAAGTRSGSIAALNGTSVAAPQVARRVADALAIKGLGKLVRVSGSDKPR